MTSCTRKETVKVAVAGRCSVDDGRAAFCVSDEITTEGIFLKTALLVRRGEQVQVQLRNIGIFRGRAVRVMIGGFVVAPSGRPMELQRLVKKLRNASEAQAGTYAARRHARVRPDVTATLVSWRQGKAVSGQIIDMSASGIAVQLEANAEVGQIIKVGETLARIVRIVPHEDAKITVGAVFTNPINEDEFGPHFQP